ncbi:sialate O-acetylesterase [Altererythrobacter salegens]|uniref:Sialate O-acetylesterase n=1 Tax=Croceibacterium salegens TaxID=1737568 RepID=A0A6I4SZF4_9SPHN|nr:sialate O-acetylesterase [Croceibacterium salegens]MXO60166.1 sialate O-acetylesterase [Croceibacterium salegens]
MIRTGLALAALATAGAASAAPVLTPVWTDHAVIQRDRPVVVEGTAAPGEKLSATLGTATATATAAKDGTFALTFPARAASSDPVALTVNGADGSSTIVSDLLVGDVWLCSGQSNMAFTVAAGLNGYNNIQVSADPLLRMLTVPLDTAARPVKEFSGKVEWQKASRETTGSFSAACYYMLKDLRTATGIPQGAVHSSWGGSQIRAWVTPEAGRALYGTDQMALLEEYGKDPLAAVTTFAPKWEAWWRGAKGNEPWNDPDALQWKPVPAIAPWTDWGDGAPAVVDTVWFRHALELTAEQAKAGGELNIGIIDDLDATWVNGHPVGINHGWSTERKYRIPAEFLKPGHNEIVFAGSNSWGGGGMQSGADRLYFTPTGGATIPLGAWQYSDGLIGEQPPRAPWDANAGIGVMHNRMIAPIGRYAMKGAAWYQGESDVGLPGYEDRLRELFAGWRRQFGADMRMLVVQLANYGPTASEPVASGWAEIRQKELDAVEADPNAALATAIDIGDWRDIHPSNKVELGRRLALAAEGTPLPMPEGAKLEGSTITVSFSGVEGGLSAWSGPYPLAVELCGETQESCRWANAIARQDTFLIPADGKPATRVRYGWADSPVVNTYDARALPVPGFELPITQ